MAQVVSKRTFISHNEIGYPHIEQYDPPSEIKNLLLVPALGNHTVYEIEDDSQIVNIDFIVNTDLFDYIRIEHSVGSNYRESIFKISELTEHDGMVTVPLDPSSWKISIAQQADSVQAIAYLVNKVIIESATGTIEYYEGYSIPCVFYVLNKAEVPVSIWMNDPTVNFVVFSQIGWLSPLCVISSSDPLSPYYCVSQGDVSAGVD